MLLIEGDCLEKLKDVSDNSVDIIIADLPYTMFKHLKWDTPIDLEKLWEQIWRVSKDTTPVFLFGDMKFGIQLINSQPKHFKYELVWNKGKSTTPLLSKKRLGKATEYVFIFYKKQCLYNYEPYHKILKTEKPHWNGSFVGATPVFKESNYYDPPLPINVIKCPTVMQKKIIKNITEKPQGVLEFLLKYFSKEGDTCLDMCMGSGSCGVACKTLNRQFIGIELNSEHYAAAKKQLS